eukprot:9392133-Lingulodinium_polyedra.AAC.1
MARQQCSASAQSVPRRRAAQRRAMPRSVALRAAQCASMPPAAPCRAAVHNPQRVLLAAAQ